MPWIDRKELEGLQRRAFIHSRCKSQTYWVRQMFLKNFLDEYLDGQDISRLRDIYDRELEAYVEKRCEEKLYQATKIVEKIKKVDTSDPFHEVRRAIAEFEGKA